MKGRVCRRNGRNWRQGILIFLSILFIKSYFFGGDHNQSLLQSRNEGVQKKKKSVVISGSMVRIVNSFYTNGIAAFLVLGQDND